MSSGRAIRAGAAFVELSTRDQQLVKGLRAASKRLQAFGANVRAMGLRMVVAGGALITPLIASVKNFANVGDSLQKMSLRTGVTTEALSELGFAAEQSGADLDILERSLMRMQATLAGGSRLARSNLALLGLSIEELSKLLPEQQFKLIADRLSQVQDPTLKAALAMNLFGKSGQKLIPLLSEGRKGIEDLQREAQRLGLTVSSQDAQAAANYADAWNRLSRTFRAASFVVGSALAPLFTDLFSRVTRFIVGVIDWIKQNKALVVTIFKVATAIVAAGAGLIALGTIISIVGFALGSLVTLIGAIATGFALIGKVVLALLSPMGLLVGVAVALGAYLLFASESGGQALAWLGERFGLLKHDAITAWGAIGKALSSGDIGLASRILWLTLKMEWQRGIHFLNGLWVKFKNFFLGITTDAIFGSAKIINDGWSGIEVAWTETIGFLADAWSLFTNVLTKTWHNTVGFIRKAWVRLKALFNSDIDVETEVSRINKETSTANQQADNRMLDAVGKRDRERRERRQQVERDRVAVNQTLTEMQRAEHENRQRGFDNDLVKTQQELSQAKEEWQAALAEAQAAPASDESTPTGKKLKDLEHSLALSADLLGEEQKKVQAKGTFNAFGARGLGSDSLAERTAKATEQIVINTKGLLDEAKQGGLVFQ